MGWFWWLERLLQIQVSWASHSLFSLNRQILAKLENRDAQRWTYACINPGLVAKRQIFLLKARVVSSSLHPVNTYTKCRPTVYEQGWTLGHLMLVTRSSKSTSRPHQSCHITHFIPIWWWSIFAGPARLHYPQTNCEMAIMSVQACGGNGPLRRPSAFTNHQWDSDMGLDTLLRPVNIKTLKNSTGPEFR